MSERETNRVTVRTSVPRYQKDEWETHADEMDMSLSEFVRSMVQAGRRGLAEDSGPERPSGSPSDAAGQRSIGYREHLLEALADGEYVSWDDLVAETVGDIEADLEAELQSLIAENRVVHSPRKDGYRLVE